MLTLNGISYQLPDGKLLLDNISFSLSNFDKASLIGNNGVGKSTLFRIINGEIHAQGNVAALAEPYYVPQVVGQFDDLTPGQALRVHDKLNALKNILRSNATEEDLITVGDDWTLEDRIAEALDYWGLAAISTDVKLGSLSGGQRTKLFLAGLMVHDPDLILMDEPTNHLDLGSRKLLFDYIAKSKKTMLITSHDRTLLNMLKPTFELSAKGVTTYGGNYDFYREQFGIEQNALADDVRSKEKILRKAKEKERESLQRQQKLNSRGKGKQEKAGIPTIVLNTLKNSAERSTSKLRDVHAAKIDNISSELAALRHERPDTAMMKFDIDDARLHTGKMLFEAIGLNFGYEGLMWSPGLDFQIRSGERIALKGMNGSGKSTLIRIVLGALSPLAGQVKRASFEALYIDQDYSLLDSRKTVVEQAQAFNTGNLEEHEVNIRLNRLLFSKDLWMRPCGTLSGGEKMRLTLCCLHLSQRAPDMIVLDEPTNNLDIRSAEILTSAINSYKGTVIAISHDEHFLQSINTQRTIQL